MFNLRLCNAATIRYSLLKFGHMHLCGKGYKHFSPHCCKCSSFGCIAAIKCGNTCHGPHCDSVYSAPPIQFTEASQVWSRLPQPMAGADWLKTIMTRWWLTILPRIPTLRQLISDMQTTNGLFEDVISRLAKLLLNFNGGLAKLGLTSSVK